MLLCLSIVSPFEELSTQALIILVFKISAISGLSSALYLNTSAPIEEIIKDGLPSESV